MADGSARAGRVGATLKNAEIREIWRPAKQLAGEVKSGHDTIKALLAASSFAASLRRLPAAGRPNRRPAAGDRAGAGARRLAGRLDPQRARDLQPLRRRRRRPRPSMCVTRLTHAPLVRVNRATGELEPWLAEKLDDVAPTA